MTLTTTFRKSDDEQRMIWGWANVATYHGVPVVDRQDDVVTIEDLRHAAHEFMKSYRVGGEMHEVMGVGTVVESLVIDKDLKDVLKMDIPEEGWFIGTKVHDDAVWAMVKSGARAAYSIGGSGRRVEMEKSLDPAAQIVAKLDAHIRGALAKYNHNHSRANGEFASGPDNFIPQEAASSGPHGYVPETAKATPAQITALNAQVESALTNKATGRDVVSEALKRFYGIDMPVLKKTPGIGVFEGAATPNTIVHLPKKVSHDALDKMAALRGLLLGQEAQVWSRRLTNNAPASATEGPGYVMRLGTDRQTGAITPAQYQQLHQIISSTPELKPLDGSTFKDGAVFFRNFGDTPEPQYRALLNLAAHKLHESAGLDTAIKAGRYEGNYLDQGSYLAALGSRPDAVRWAADYLQRKVAPVYLKHAAAIGAASAAAQQRIAGRVQWLRQQADALESKGKKSSKAAALAAALAPLQKYNHHHGAHGHFAATDAATHDPATSDQPAVTQTVAPGPVLAPGTVSPAFVSQQETPYDTDDVIRARLLGSMFPSTHLDTSPARVALRQQIAADLFNPNTPQGYRADIIMGRSGSGKSSVIANQLKAQYGSMEIDSDEAKRRLPEYADPTYNLPGRVGTAAGMLHEESSDIASAVTAAAITHGYNVILPVVGKTLSGLNDKIDALKALGYEVHLHFVDMPAERSVPFTITRYESGKQGFVDPKYQLQIGDKPTDNFNVLKHDSRLAETVHYDNTEPHLRPARTTFQWQNPDPAVWRSGPHGRNAGNGDAARDDATGARDGGASGATGLPEHHAVGKAGRAGQDALEQDTEAASRAAAAAYRTAADAYERLGDRPLAQAHRALADAHERRAAIQAGGHSGFPAQHHAAPPPTPPYIPDNGMRRRATDRPQAARKALHTALASIAALLP